MFRQALIGVLSVLACAGSALAAGKFTDRPVPKPVARAAATSAWIGTWGASPATPTTVATARAPLTVAFHNQTLRQVVRISAGGRQVRIRLSNAYGTAPLRIGAARVALAGQGGAVVPGSDHELHFSQHPGTVIPPGAVVLSDPVDMPVAPLASLAVSVFLPGDTGLCTCHGTGAATGYASGDGDFTKAEAFPAKSTFFYRAYLSGVEVNTALPAAAIVVLGDSISDGAVSTPDANHRWPDRLAERLNAPQHGQAPRRAWGVVNAGISGNRLLLDGTGQSGLARFDRDVLAVPGVRYLVLLLGVNDLGHAFGPLVTPPSALDPEDLISGYRQIIARAHAHGIKVYGATVTPYEGAAYWSAKGDGAREDLNSWMRVAGAFDALIDFDAVWRDPAHPARIKPGYGAPDHLHGTDAGYQALGDAVPLALFK